MLPPALAELHVDTLTLMASYVAIRREASSGNKTDQTVSRARTAEAQHQKLEQEARAARAARTG